MIGLLCMQLNPIAITSEPKDVHSRNNPVRQIYGDTEKFIYSYPSDLSAQLHSRSASPLVLELGLNCIFSKLMSYVGMS